MSDILGAMKKQKFTRDDLIDELKKKGSYRYNPKTKKLERLDEEGNLIKSY